MRASIAVAAGLVAVASAKTSTVTDTAADSTADPAWGDWTSTTTTTPVAPVKTSSYDPTWGDWTSTTTPVAPVKTSSYDPTWGDWTSTTTPVAPVKASSTWDPAWGDWSSYNTTTTKKPVSVAVTSTAPCGVYTATTPPAWFSLLPTDVLSSIEAKWTGAPPTDWCYYTYSTSTLYTSPVSPASSTPYWPAGTTSKPVAAASGTAVWSYTPSSPVAAVATYTGAANANAGSFALAGLAAAAALVIA